MRFPLHDLMPQAHITNISQLPGFRRLHRIFPSIYPWYYTPFIYIKRLSFHFFSSVSGMGSCRTPLWSRAKREISFWKIGPQRKKNKNLERWQVVTKDYFESQKILKSFRFFFLFLFFPCLDTHSIGGKPYKYVILPFLPRLGKPEALTAAAIVTKEYCKSLAHSGWITWHLRLMQTSVVYWSTLWANNTYLQHLYLFLTLSLVVSKRPNQSRNNAQKRFD